MNKETFIIQAHHRPFWVYAIQSPQVKRSEELMEGYNGSCTVFIGTG
jgi:hypothetical protein